MKLVEFVVDGLFFRIVGFFNAIFDLRIVDVVIDAFKGIEFSMIVEKISIDECVI